MVRTILKSVFAFGAVYMVWNVGPVYLHYQEFKPEASEATRGGGRGPEQELMAEVARLADRVGVPVAREAIRVRKERTRTYLEVTYTEELRLAPTVTYPWTFTIKAEGLAMKPQTVSDVIGEVLPGEWSEEGGGNRWASPASDRATSIRRGSRAAPRPSFP